ncbi:MAG: hypothetical protein PHT19_08235 [Methylococcus sp.]|nr:hypothetical protein [Methylococcus sp.]
MPPSEYTLKRAAEMLGVCTEELLSDAANGHIKLVFIASDTAPVQVSGLCQTFDIDGNLICETALKPKSLAFSNRRLQIVAPTTSIDKLSDGESVDISIGLVYSSRLKLLDRAQSETILDGAPAHDKYVSIEPPKSVALADLRVPAEEVERIAATLNNQSAQATPRGDAGDAGDGKSIIDRRITAILEGILELGYQCCDIPKEGKSKIEGWCLENRRTLRWTQGEYNTFNEAWKKASRKGIIAIRGKAAYTKGR